MRRQTGAGASRLAGSSCGLRLDPRTLPIRFEAVDAAADGRMRVIEIDHERVLLCRTVRGVRMRINLPLAAYLGVAVRLLPTAAGADYAIAIVLEHHDSQLSVPLHIASDTDHVIAEWKLWARALKQPLLVAERDGALREPFARLGKLPCGKVVARRVRRTALRARRPRMFRRRSRMRSTHERVVYRGEYEIIARD